MPKYDYRCMMCNEVTELSQPMSFAVEPQIKCGACGNPAQRLYSSPGAVFKGGGFYSTDNPRPPKPRS